MERNAKMPMGRAGKQHGHGIQITTLKNVVVPSCKSWE